MTGISVIRYDRFDRRVWVFKARIHHGLLGAGLVIVGLALIANDWHDFPWLTD